MTALWSRWQRRHPVAPRQRGFALLIVLWSMVLLSLLFARLVSAGRSEAEIASNLRAAATLQAEADGVFYSTVFSLLGGPGSHWPADGTVHQLRLASTVAGVSIVNLAGRINPNTASTALLDALLRRVGADAMTAEDVSRAIVDWRSPDAQGAFKAPRYLAAGLPYAPAGSAFQSIREIGLVLGMNPQLLAKLAPDLSLYTGDNPDPRYADPIVRAAMHDAGMLAVSTSAARPLRAVAVSVSIVAANGAAAYRQADIELNTSASASGFSILTWQSGLSH